MRSVVVAFTLLVLGGAANAACTSMCERADAAAVSKRDRSAADLSCNDLSDRRAFARSPQPSRAPTSGHLTMQAGAGLRFLRQLPMAAGLSLARRARYADHAPSFCPSAHRLKTP